MRLPNDPASIRNYRTLAHLRFALAAFLFLVPLSSLQAKQHRHHHPPQTYLQFIYYINENGAQPAAKSNLDPNEPTPERRYMHPEKPPPHYPSNRDFGGPGAWEPPHNPFNSKIAVSCILTPFIDTITPADRRFGDPNHDVHIEGFVCLQLSGPSGSEPRRRSAEISILRLGAGTESENFADDSTAKHYLLVTSHGKTLFRQDLEETTFPSHTEYTLSRVKTQFGKEPMLLLFADFGAGVRMFSYQLYRIRPDGLEKVWECDWEDDGHSGSMQQGFGYSNFDFSALRSGRANEFGAYSISGARRWMLPGDEAYLKPRYTHRLYRWDKAAGKYLKVSEHTFTKSSPAGRSS